MPDTGTIAVDSHRYQRYCRPPSARRSLFEPIRGIVRGTDSLPRCCAQHLKSHVQIIEISRKSQIAQ
jgi:hypothetical protein